MGTEAAQVQNDRQQGLWKISAVMGLVSASWLGGILLQERWGMSAGECSCGGGRHQRLERKVEEEYERLRLLEGDFSRLRREFERFVGGKGLGERGPGEKGLGIPTGASAEKGGGS